MLMQSAINSEGSDGERNPMKNAAHTLFRTREEYIANGGITWNAVKASTVSALQVRAPTRKQQQ
eukprot:1183904-Prorocentrum_minimum.AAC.3